MNVSSASGGLHLPVAGFSRSGGEGFVHSNRIWSCVSNSVLNSTLVCRRSSSAVVWSKQSCGAGIYIGRDGGGTQAAGGGISSGNRAGCSGKLVVQCIGRYESGSSGGEKRKNGILREGKLEDPGVYVASKREGGTYDVNLAWELLRQDVLYLDWKARHDVSTIVAAHDKVRDSDDFLPLKSLQFVCFFWFAFHCGGRFKDRSRVFLFCLIQISSTSRMSSFHYALEYFRFERNCIIW